MLASSAAPASEFLEDLASLGANPLSSPRRLQSDDVGTMMLQAKSLLAIPAKSA